MNNFNNQNFPKDIIKDEFLLFEKRLLKVIDTKDYALNKPVKAFVFAPSKRLRPIITILFSKILKIDSPYIINIATSIELIHCASLLHDDILDDEVERRNSIPFYKTFGNKKALLAGDLLLSLALEELSNTNIKIIKTITKKIQNTIFAELNQNNNTGKIVDIDLYYKKTFEKTGNLFMAGLEALFDITDVNEKLKENLKNCCKNFSMAFQIRNDINNIIKKDMSDIKNGNYTLPVLYFFMENLNFDLNNLNQKDLEKYILKANNKVEEFKKEALISLNDVENSNYKSGLIQLIQSI